MNGHSAVVSTALGRLATTLYRGNPEHVPLVLAHGIYMDSTLWEGILPAMSDRIVLTVDGPGHGHSEAPPAGWTLDDHVEALVDVLDYHGLDRSVLVGHSWGGMVSLRLALAHPQRVAGLGLVNTPLTRTRGRSRLGFRAQQAMLLATGPAHFYGRQAASSLYGKETLRLHPNYADELTARLSSRRRSTLTGTLSAVILEPDDMTDQLRHVTVPTCVIVSVTDYVFPDSTRRAVTSALPTASITVVAGGHISPHESPTAATEALRDLLKDVDRT